VFHRTDLNRLDDLAPRLCAPLLHCIVLFCTILYCTVRYRPSVLYVYYVTFFYFYKMFRIDGGNLDLTNKSSYEQTSGLPLF